MNYRVLLLAASIGILQATASAQTAPDTAAAKPAIMVELFTAEGCSSCPPADAMLVALDGKNFDGSPIIVLSEHVDYWNHDGWRDPFSDETWTRRQNSYNEHFHLDNIYTPQMVIDGAQQVNGSDKSKIVPAIQTSATQPGKIKIEIADAAWSGDLLHATVSITDVSPQTAKGVTLYAVLADDEDTSNVLRGENSGHTLKHVAVVRTMQKISSLKGPFSGPVQVKLPRGVAHNKMRLIIFAQKGDNGQIFGAAQVEV